MAGSELYRSKEEEKENNKKKLLDGGKHVCQDIHASLEIAGMTK